MDAVERMDAGEAPPPQTRSIFIPNLRSWGKRNEVGSSHVRSEEIKAHGRFIMEEKKRVLILKVKGNLYFLS